MVITKHTVRMYILHIALAHLHMDAHLHMRFDKNRSMCIIVHYHLYEFSKTAISGQNKPNSAMIFLVWRGAYQTHNFVHFAYLLGIWGRSENLSEEVFFTVFLVKN